MGIRINKVIGWGVKLNVRSWQHQYGDGPNQSYTKHAVEDPRIDIEAMQAKDDEWYEYHMGDVVQWLEEAKPALRNETLGLAFLKKDTFGTTDSPMTPEPLHRLIIHHGDDGGIPGVLLFIPPNYSDRWHRRDDTIDWMEETYLQDGGQQDRVAWFERSAGIYPWNGWRRFRGDSLEFQPPDGKSELADGGMSPATYARLVGTWSKSASPLADEKLIRHLREDWRPVVPSGIEAMVHFLASEFPEALKDPDDLFNHLRPMEYVFWC